MDVNISKADYIDQFLRTNGATGMAIIIYNSMALTKLLKSAIIMFIPSDFALDKIIRTNLERNKKYQGIY